MSRQYDVWSQHIVPMLNKIKYDHGPLLNNGGGWWDADVFALPVPYKKLKGYSGGLEFRHDEPGNQRRILYDRREDIQAQFQLYFAGYPAGIRFTMKPKLGMLWRLEQEQRDTQRALTKTHTMTLEAIKASGGLLEAGLFEAIAKKYDDVMIKAGRLRTTTETLLVRPETPTLLPPGE